MKKNLRIDLQTRIEYTIRTTTIVLKFLVTALVLRFFVVDIGFVNGQSMEPTYQDGNRFLINKVAFFIAPPKRYDKVQIFEPTDGDVEKLLIKRIIGLPGETVTIRQSGVTVKTVTGDELELDETYLREGTVTIVKPGQSPTVTLQENEFYVMGDNRLYSSIDSRSFGPVHRKFIIGKATGPLEGLFKR